MHESTHGFQKIAAVACGVGPSRFSAMCNGQEPPYSVQQCRVIDTAIAEGAADPFAELRLIADRYGFDLTPQRAAEDLAIEKAISRCAKENGDVLSLAIEALPGSIKPEECARLEAAIQEEIEALHLLRRKFQAATVGEQATAFIRGRR